jgi:hypothetical protein
MSGVLQGVDKHITEHIAVAVTSCNFLCFFSTPRHVCMAWLRQRGCMHVSANGVWYVSTGEVSHMTLTVSTTRTSHCLLCPSCGFPLPAFYYNHQRCLNEKVISDFYALTAR